MKYFFKKVKDIFIGVVCADGPIFQYQGCYTDRAFTVIKNSGTMTPNTCIDECRAQGYAYAGVTVSWSYS